VSPLTYWFRLTNTNYLAYFILLREFLGSDYRRKCFWFGFLYPYLWHFSLLFL
jgi:hypothetical protein